MPDFEKHRPINNEVLQSAFMPIEHDRFKLSRLPDEAALNACFQDTEAKIHSYGEPFGAVVLGEIHFQKKLIDIQAAVIRALRPEIILVEGLKVYEKSPRTGHLKVIPGRLTGREYMAGRVEPPHRSILAAGKEVGARFVGCDLCVTELMDLVPLRRPDLENLPIDQLLYKFDFELPWRDEHMAAMIEKYTLEAKSVVVAIIGADHANEIHRAKYLQNMPLGYASIDLSPLIEGRDNNGVDFRH
jgi:hypothetical protein